METEAKIGPPSRVGWRQQCCRDWVVGKGVGAQVNENGMTSLRGLTSRVLLDEQWTVPRPKMPAERRTECMAVCLCERRENWDGRSSEAGGEGSAKEEGRSMDLEDCVQRYKESGGG